MLNCLMYKLVYYRFGEVKIKRNEDRGFDSVRGAIIGNRDFELTHFEEAFTSERWLVRIYKVLPLPAMAPSMTSRFSNVPVPKISPKMSRPTF